MRSIEQTSASLTRGFTRPGHQAMNGTFTPASNEVTLARSMGGPLSPSTTRNVFVSKPRCRSTSSSTPTPSSTRLTQVVNSATRWRNAGEFVPMNGKTSACSGRTLALGLPATSCRCGS